MARFEFERIPITQTHLDWLVQLGILGQPGGTGGRPTDAELSSMELLRYTPGSYIIQENELADAVYIIFKGKAQASRGGSMLGSMSAGAVIGELGIMLQRPSSATVTADQDCEVFRLGRPMLLDLQLRHPGLLASLLSAAKKHLVHA